jgi:hypothetical protein
MVPAFSYGPALGSKKKKALIAAWGKNCKRAV